MGQKYETHGKVTSPVKETKVIATVPQEGLTDGSAVNVTVKRVWSVVPYETAGVELGVTIPCYRKDIKKQIDNAFIVLEGYMNKQEANVKKLSKKRRKELGL